MTFENLAYDARYVAKPQRRPRVLLLALCLPLALLLAMLALTPLGHWQMDELLMMRAYRESGLSALYSRIVNWSFRPLSEALLYAYTSIVHATGRQLTGTFLLSLWALLMAACILPPLLSRGGGAVGRRLPVLVGATLLALLISGHPVSEVFYWTQAAAAYVPTIAFLTSALLCLAMAQQRTLKLDVLVTLLVILAALSVEVGAFFAVAWGAGAPLVLWLGRIAWGEGKPRLRRSDAQFLLPLGAGLSVIYMLSIARFGSQAEIFDASIAHSIPTSLWWTLRTFPSEVVAVNLGSATAAGLALGLVSKTALFAFCLIAFTRSSRNADLDLRLLVTAFGLAAVASSLFSLFAAYYQFGVNCCQRHETIRSQLGIVAIVAFAWAVAQLPLASRLGRLSTSWIAIASTVAVVASAAYMPAALFSDLSNYRRIMQARAANWQAGHADSPVMVLDLSHSGQVIGPIYAPGGEFEDVESTPRPLRAMMHYFDKTKIIAR